MSTCFTTKATYANGKTAMIDNIDIYNPKFCLQNIPKKKETPRANNQFQDKRKLFADSSVT